MSNPIVICAAASVALHIALGLSLAFWKESHPYQLYIAPAKKSMVDVHLMKIPASTAAMAAKPEQKVVTTTAPADFQVNTPVKPAPVKKTLVVKSEPVKEPKTQKKALQKVVTKPAVEAPKVVSKTVEAVAVESKVEDASVQGASSEYHRIDKPQLAGRQKQPAYPYRARKLGHQGTVILDVKLDDAGKVVDIVVEKTSGHSSLDKAALSTVKRWNFQPLLKNGKGIRSRVRIPVQFRLG